MPQSSIASSSTAASSKSRAQNVSCLAIVNQLRRSLRHIKEIMLALAITGSLAGDNTTGQPLSEGSNAEVLSSEFIATALSPFWRAHEISEPVFFIQGDGMQRPQARLLFKPRKVLSVRSATREATFEAGKDFTMDVEARTISLPESSRI